MNEDSKSAKTQVLIAVIGVLGVLGTALIANLDRVFPSRPHTPEDNRSASQQVPTTTQRTTTQRTTTQRAALEEQQRPADAKAKMKKEVSYKKMDFGFDGCHAKFGEVLKGVTEEDMIKRASAANANGFAFHPSLGYGTLLLGEYPKDCKSPSNMSWPLYLRQ
jgi:hypothetical protein